MAAAHPDPPASTPAPPAPAPTPVVPTIPGLSLPSLHKRSHPPRARIFALVDLDGAVVAAGRRPLWVASLLVAMVFALLPPVAFLAAASRGQGVSAVVLDELHKSGKLKDLTAEQRHNVEAAVVPIMTAALPIGAVVKRLGFLLVCAGLVFAVLKGTRKELRLTAVVAAAVVGAAPWYVHDVISAVTFSVVDLAGIDPQNPVASNPAAWFFSGKESRTALAVLLRGVDFFDVWGCAWLSLALTRAVGGRSNVPVVVVVGLHVAGVGQGLVSAVVSQAAG